MAVMAAAEASSALFRVFMARTVALTRAGETYATRFRATVRRVNTPALLTRTALYVLGVQLALVIVVALAVPGGTSLLTLAGFVTPYYDRNFLAMHLFPIPWTDPTVYVSIQSLAQMVALALLVAGAVGLVKTNPWQHGVLPDSTPPPRDGGPSPAAGSSGGNTTPVSPPPGSPTPGSGPSTPPSPPRGA